MRSKFKWIFTLLVAFTMQFSFAQQKTVTGTVTSDGAKLPGATVSISGTKQGTQTDENGKFSIKAAQGDVLEVSFLGKDTKTVTVGAGNVINVTLATSQNVIDEVVIKDYGLYKKDANKTATAVSVVTGEEFVKQNPALSFQNALQGKAAGVQVTAANGRPGQGGYVTIRGVVSITGGYTGAAYVVDGAFVSEGEATAIGPQDIETLTVLKDGASAAIYGARGGNGVVVITTRKGKNTKTKFEINSSFGFAERLKDPFRLMNVDEKIAYEQALGDGPIVTNGYTPAQIDVLRRNAIDWEAELLRKSTQRNLTFTMSGGNAKFNNYLSVGLNKDSGIIERIEGYNRITASYNSEYTANDKLKIGFSARGAYEKNTLPRDRYNTQNPFAAIMWYNPYESVYNRDINTGEIILDANGKPTYNLTHTGFPIAEALINNTEETRFFRGYARPTLQYKFLKNLIFDTKLSYNFETRNRESWIKPNSVLDGYVGNPSSPGSKTDQMWINLDTQWTNSLNYTFTLGDNHNFDSRIVYDYQYFNFRSNSNSRTGFAGDYQTAGTTPTAASSSRSEQGLFGLAGVLDYDFNGKYILSAYGRKDWSSLLGYSNNSAIAKGGALAWVVTKDILQSSNTLSYLKLRASWGQLNATTGLGLYQNISTFGTSNYAGGLGTLPTGDNIANPNLQFEQVEKLDLGFESRLLNNNILLSFSYFQDERNNFLYGDFTGDGASFSTTRNVGAWTSKGFETEIKAFAIKKENMNLSFYVNAATFDRSLDKLNPPFTDEIIRGFQKNIIGYAPDTYFLVRYAGVDPTNGDALYYDLNGNKTNVYSANNRVLLEGKTPYAKYEGGFGMQFDYRGFDIGTDFVFKQGNYIYNLRYRDLLTDGVSVADNQSVEALDYWTPTNTDASLPAPIQLNGGVDTNQDSDRWLEDGSYIRFRNLNLGYTFSKKTFKNFPIESVRVYTQVQNLYTWTKFNGDPEVGIGNAESGTVIPGQYNGYSYSNTKSFLFGINVKF